VRGICVTLGQPGALCWAITDGSGNYTIDSSSVVTPGSSTQFQLYFFTCNVGVRSLDGRSCTSPTAGYPVQASDTFVLSSVMRKDWSIHH
jgi:hypothetical protein